MRVSLEKLGGIAPNKQTDAKPKEEESIFNDSPSQANFPSFDNSFSNEDIFLQSLENLDSIVAKYTDRDDLTTDDYAKIITLNKLNSDFYSLSQMYQNEEDSLGFVDKVYDFLKEIDENSISKADIEEELESKSRANNALQASINSDYDTALYNSNLEFQNRLAHSQTLNDKFLCFVDFCADEDSAIEAFNKYLSEIKDDVYDDIKLEKNPSGEPELKYKLAPYNPYTMEENDNSAYESFPIGQQEYIPPHLSELLTKEASPEVLEYNAVCDDFESIYKYFYDREYNFDNVMDYINKSNVYSFINLGLSNIYNFEEKLQNSTTMEGAMEIFLDKNHGDKNSAIKEFNDFYSKYLNNVNSPLKSIKARLNDETDEIEYVFEAENKGLFSSNKEYVFNSEKMYESADISYYMNEKAMCEDYLAEINSYIYNNHVLENEFKSDFEQQTQMTVEDAFGEYYDAYDKISANNGMENTIKNYFADMDSYPQKISTFMSLGSIGLSLVCPSFGIMALAGVFSDNLIDGINIATNKKDDEAGKYFSDLAQEAMIVAIGMGIGMGANGANRALSASLSKNTNMSLKSIMALGTSLEVALDFSLGAAFDYATVGDFNLSGNALSVFLDIQSGVAGYRALMGDVPSTLAREAAESTVRIDPQDDLFAVATAKADGADVHAKPVDAVEASAAKAGEPEIAVAPEDAIDPSAKINEPDGTSDTPDAVGAAARVIEPDSPLATPKDPEAEITPEAKEILDAQAHALEVEGGKYINEAKTQIKQLVEGTDTRVIARAKEKDSILSKLESKFKKGIMKLLGKSDAEIYSAAKRLVRDDLGTRIIFKPLSKEQALETVEKIISSQGIETNLTPAEILSKLATDELDSSVRTPVLTGIRREYSQQITDRIIKGIRDKTLTITEINNYGLQDFAYFTTDQLYSIIRANNEVNNTTIGLITAAEDVNVLKARLTWSDEELKGVEFLNESSTKPSGYTAFQMNITHTFEDGTIGYGELQIRGEDLNLFADSEHVLYDIWGGKIKPEDSRYSEIYPIVNNLSDNSKKTYLKYISDTYQYMRYKEMGIDMKKPSMPSLELQSGRALMQDELYMLSKEGLCDFYKKLHP